MTLSNKLITVPHSGVTLVRLSGSGSGLQLISRPVESILMDCCFFFLGVTPGLGCGSGGRGMSVFLYGV